MNEPRYEGGKACCPSCTVKEENKMVDGYVVLERVQSDTFRCPSCKQDFEVPPSVRMAESGTPKLL